MSCASLWKKRSAPGVPPPCRSRGNPPKSSRWMSCGANAASRPGPDTGVGNDERGRGRQRREPEGRGRSPRAPTVSAAHAPDRAADAEAGAAVNRLPAMLMVPGKKPVHHLHADRVKRAERGAMQRLRAYQHAEPVGKETDEQPARGCERETDEQ